MIAKVNKFRVLQVGYWRFSKRHLRGKESKEDTILTDVGRVGRKNVISSWRAGEWGHQSHKGLQELWDYTHLQREGGRRGQERGTIAQLA